MPANDCTLTAERLRELLHYDPATGIFTWRVARKGTKGVGSVAGTFHRSTGYWKICIDYVQYHAHRLAFLYMTGEWPAEHVDHIDRDKGNDRWANLREATQSQNNANRPAMKTSAAPYKGVLWYRERWRARIFDTPMPWGRWLGTFDTAEEAARAYDRAARERWGEFAYTNFPD